MRWHMTRQSVLFFAVCLLSVFAAVSLSSCGGGGGGGGSSSGSSSSFNDRSIDLYTEVPAIEIQGNDGMDFNPQTSRSSELYDTDQDGVKDTPINDFQSLCNSANRVLDIELAACVKKTGEKHLGYEEASCWVSDSLLPDKMPTTVGQDGTSGTQFVQLIVPFKVKQASIFKVGDPGNDYLNTDYLTIEDEDGNHVPCTVLINGVDVNGEGPGGAVGSVNPYQGLGAECNGVTVNPGSDMSSIIFIAQTDVGQTGTLPDDVPFPIWAQGKDEIRIWLKQAKNNKGKLINVDSKWSILKDGGTPEDIEVEEIYASSALKDDNGLIYKEDDLYPIVDRSTSFIIRFNKPVLPETVGQSIVFAAAPFNGNTGPIPTSLAVNPPVPNPCEDGGAYHDPIAPNVVLLSTLVFADGTESGVAGVVPFRIYPLHQNNLCTYILNPVLDLPGSREFPLIPDDPINDPDNIHVSVERIRVTLRVFTHDDNTHTGSPIELAAPVNMGLTGFFGQDGELNTAVSDQTFLVSSGGRYVNAPVCPMALYYAMGPKGLGVVDLDGNGFTTNDPDFTKIALVTSEKFYNRFGNAGMGIGNDYSYGAKAVGGAPPYIGLGSNTPMPGVNEGSTGIDSVVRDSDGDARLFPDPTGGEKFFNISDVEVGNFLDTIYFDVGNEWAHKSYHLSAINIAATGNWSNNLISTPPTPNPPPLSVPVGMRATHVILDEFELSEEGAFVITGKEVFTVDLPGLLVGYAPKSGFIHLLPADLAGSQTDESFPPNRSTWPGAMGPTDPDYMNLGPVADSSTIGIGWYYGSRQQIGNFLFVADKANNQVRVLNSNTMDLITSLTGLSSPDSVAVSSDLKKLYVSNSGGGYVTVFNVNPKSDDFLNPVTNIWVGAQPKGICCQPDLDDVLVCNYGSNTISIINPITNTVRKTVSSLVNKPWDLVAAPRQFTGLGFSTGVYHAYISNYGGDNILIFESGPDGIGGIGYDDILDPVPQTGQNGQQFLHVHNPRGLCYDPLYNTQSMIAGGCYVAHSAGSYAVVSRIQFCAQQGPQGPIFLIPNAGSVGGTPGFGKRVFEIVAQWGGVSEPLSGTSAIDIALLDYNRERWLDQNWLSSFFVTSLGDLGGNPTATLPINNKHPIRIISGAVNPTLLPDLMYVAYQYTPVIDVLDPASSQVVKAISGLPGGARVLKTYFKF